MAQLSTESKTQKHQATGRSFKERAACTVSILFDRQWSDGVVCEARPKEKQSLGGNFFT